MRIAWLVFAGQYVCLDKPLAFRHHRGMCLMQDGTTSHIFEPFACSCLGHPNPVKHNWDVIGKVVRIQGLANYKTIYMYSNSNGRLERNYTAHVECRGTCM